MRTATVALLVFAALVLSSCGHEKPLPDGFVCVMPLSRHQMEQAQYQMSCYEEARAGSGRYVPKGWIAVPYGAYKGCYVPFQNHDMRSTVPPH